jgi:UDP-glucose 4-epimerase
MKIDKKILVTGVAGFLGSHLARRLLEQGYDVAGNDTLASGYSDNVPIKVKFSNTDCRDLEGMKKITREVDAVYHCAAYPYEGVSVFSPSVVTDSVFQATCATLTAFISNKGKRFITCSSMARYGMNQTPFTEDMEPRPQDPYAVAKVAAEQLIKLMSHVHDFEYVIAVPHNIFGPGQIYNDPFRNVAAIFANRMLQGKQPIIYGDGSQKRCLSYIEDDIVPLLKLLTQDNIVGETINIGPDEEFITINGLARTIADIIGFDLKPEYYPERPQEVKEANCSANKARRLLGFETKYPLRKGLEETINWINQRGVLDFRYGHLELEIQNAKTPKTWTDKLI